jgi:RNA polymerase sigma-70 factor, ECF subfamily
MSIGAILLVAGGFSVHEVKEDTPHTCKELCNEAVRLTGLLSDNAATAEPEVHALHALLLFQAARLASRVDACGDLLLLVDQDGSLWNRAMITQGSRHLERAVQGNRITSYHLQAGIAAAHAIAPSFHTTDWQYVRSLYDALVDLDPTPVAWLNRAIAIAQVEGPEAGLVALEAARGDARLDHYPFLAAAEGELYLRLGRTTPAATCFARALRLVRTEPEQRFLTQKLSCCR